MRFLLAIPFTILAAAAYAADAAPTGSVVDSIMSLWGPFCGVLSALIILFDRIAKIIPNSTDNAILSFLRKVATVLGVKVPDVQ